MQRIVLKTFEKIFGSTINTSIYFAPGRVNLIGEHTDYNGGHVFPCALTLGTYAAARLRCDNKVKLYSKNFEYCEVIEFNIDDLVYKKEHEWANYPKGVMVYLEKRNLRITSGFEIVFYGNIPNGAGLSSSASIELITAVILKDLFQMDIKMEEMVMACKEAENKFIGINCGIMDQFIIGMGKKNMAILLDTNNLSYEYVPFNFNDVSIVISNTNRQRKLSDSKYNERRSQCKAALRDLQGELGISSIGELDEEKFEKHKHLIKDNISMKRARHAVYENRRTLKAVQALKIGDIKTFGQLMNESHISLRDDYEVTGEELDTLVKLAWDQDGVIGSRMTGAGFGGCTVSIVENRHIDKFIKEVGERYLQKVGYEASFYIAQIGDGAGRI